MTADITLCLVCPPLTQADDDSPVTIASVPSNGVYTTGVTISITCTYTSGYAFDSFIHPKFGQIRMTGGNFRIFDLPNINTITLEITSPTREDEGTFFCTFNPLSPGGSRQHPSIQMVYLEPPVIIDPQLRYTPSPSRLFAKICRKYNFLGKRNRFSCQRTQPTSTSQIVYS